MECEGVRSVRMWRVSMFFSVLADVTEVNEYRCLGFSDE